MEIRWSNVIAFGMGLGALIIWVTMHRQLAEFFSCLWLIGPGHDPQQQAMGLIAAGIIAMVVVAVVKIVVNSGGKHP